MYIYKSFTLFFKILYYFKIKKCVDFFLSRSIPGIYYVILHSDDVFFYGKEKRTRKEAGIIFRGM